MISVSNKEWGERKFSTNLVDKLSQDTLQALMEGGHGVSGGTYGGLSDDAKDNVDKAVRDMALSPNMAQQALTANLPPSLMHKPDVIAQLAKQSLGNLTEQQKAALVSRYGSLKNLAYTPGEGLMNLAQQPTVSDMTTGEIVGYPSEGLTGWPAMAADLLGVDTSGVNFGVDPEAEREATRGREYAVENPLRYMTAGQLEDLPVESMMEGIMATDYANRQYYDPTYIDYAAKGGRVGMQEGGLPSLGSFVPSNWADVYSWDRGTPHQDLYGQTVGERMSTASDFWGGLSPELRQAASGWGPQDFGMRIAGGGATHDISAYNRAVADKMGTLQGLLGDTEYGDISGVLQGYAKSLRTPDGWGGAGERENRMARHRDKQIVASDHLAYLLHQQGLAGQQAEAEAEEEVPIEETQMTPEEIAAGQAADEAQQQAVIDAQEQAGQVTTHSGTQVPYAPMPDPIVYRGPGATQTFGEGQTQYYKPKYLDYAAMGATPGLLTEQGVFGGIPTTTGDWVFGNQGGRVGRMGGGMMIIEDNDVVNNGMGAILNKYKQIRSEL